jgi:hypothetical protein
VLSFVTNVAVRAPGEEAELELREPSVDFNGGSSVNRGRLTLSHWTARRA